MLKIPRHQYTLILASDLQNSWILGEGDINDYLDHIDSIIGHCIWLAGFLEQGEYLVKFNG